MSTPICPICTSAARVSRRLSTAQVAANLAPPRRDADRHRRMQEQVVRLWPAGKVEICVCDFCLLGFASPLVAGDDQFYAVLHERTGYPRERWEFRETRSTLPAATRRVLDIGAGTGDFLKTLPASIERHAIEASESLRDGLASAGITSHASIADAPDGIDLAAMFHVLQYFADPVETLARVAAKLSLEGRIVLSIPNALAAGRLDDLRSPPHPLTRWSACAIGEAAVRAGLAIERQAFIPQRASSLLWTAHARTRDAGGKLFAKVDAMRPSRQRTALLTLLAMPRLPGTLLCAPRLLKRSQLYYVLKPIRNPLASRSA